VIHVIAILTAKPGKRAEYLELFQANVPAVHAEDGCIEYAATVDVAGADPAFGPDTFVVVEKWASMARRPRIWSPHALCMFWRQLKAICAGDHFAGARPPHSRHSCPCDRNPATARLRREESLLHSKT
jgi:quinol monooxygenase YgiN